MLLALLRIDLFASAEAKKFNREKQNKIKQSKTFVKYSREFYWCGDVTFETFIFQVFDEAKRMWLYDFVVYQ